MFAHTEMDHTKNANLLIQDILEAFGKVIHKWRLIEAEDKSPQSSETYLGSDYMQDRIDWFNNNKNSNPPLSTLQSQIKCLIVLLDNCGPDDERYFTQAETDAIFDKHSDTIEYYLPERNVTMGFAK